MKTKYISFCLVTLYIFSLFWSRHFSKIETIDFFLSSIKHSGEAVISPAEVFTSG